MFKSFWLAGFDGSTGRDKNGRWFDHIAATGHDRLVDHDYGALAELGIRGVREAVRWPLVDQGGGRYDVSSLAPFVWAARRHRMDVVWDLFHYGFPDDVDLFSDAFPPRFAAYCRAVARFICRNTEGPYFFTPVNEPSFMAYAAGDKGLFAPWAHDRGWELKVSLARAAIAAIDAIREVCPDAVMVNVDPLCRVVAPTGAAAPVPEVDHFNEHIVYQSWDMLGGRLLPELGGSPEHLDVVGINYYWTNQWELGAPPDEDGIVPPLAEDDPRRQPLRDLVRQVAARYGAPIVVSETAHIGDGRARWVHEVAADARDLAGSGTELLGICLYPIIAMPTWHDPDHWPEMALWEPSCRVNPHTGRIVCEPMRDALLAVIDPEHERAARRPLRRPGRA